VQIRSAESRDAPVIAPQYRSTEADRQIAADSIRQVRAIVAQPALARYQPEKWKPGIAYQSDAELARLAGDSASRIFHPVGTTKMGVKDDPMAEVDRRRWLRGVAGLRMPG
jgi:choline dehydrogenase